MNNKLFVGQLNRDEKCFEIDIITIDNENTLDQLYKLIDCDLVDCIETNIDGELYDVWFDDEYLLKPPAIPSLIVNEQLVCNSFVIARCDEEGKTIGLDENDLEHIIAWYEYNHTILLPDVLRQLREYKANIDAAKIQDKNKE